MLDARQVSVSPLRSRPMPDSRAADRSSDRLQRPTAKRSSEYTSDPKLRAQTEMILAMPVEDRLRQLETEANFFSSVRSLDG